MAARASRPARSSTVSKADVVTLALAYDVDALHDKGN
jgi:ABC-type sulfate transport system substrate-binding protein